MEFCRSTNY